MARKPSVPSPTSRITPTAKATHPATWMIVPVRPGTIMPVTIVARITTIRSTDSQLTFPNGVRMKPIVPSYDRFGDTAPVMTAEARRTPRSIPTLLAEAFRIYARFPLLFLTLAAGVVVPYLLIVLAVTDTGPFTRSDLPFGTSLLLTLVDWVIVDSLISALHVHAVADLEEGKKPELGSVTRRGLRVLPLVSAAAIMAGLAFAGGLVLLVFPGVYLYLRLAVVAQAAAMERRSWMDALRRSWALTEDSVLRVLFFIVCLGVVEVLPTLLIHHVLNGATTAASFSVGVVIQVLVRSFEALATALLYFDLRARQPIVQVRRQELE